MRDGLEMPLLRGRYRASLATGPQDLHAAQRLRHLAFRGSAGLLDRDPLDPRCLHVLVDEVAANRLVCCFRLLPLEGGAHIGGSYSARFYDLTALEAFEGKLVEMGRFCIHPDILDPDIVRIAWAALARLVEMSGIALIFGCVSFRGTEPGPYQDAFALLKDRHLAPSRWQPKCKAVPAFRFARILGHRRPDIRRAMLAMPPLLRSYTGLGGWVSDHAVIDRDLGTMHVFTALETRAIPPARGARLRAC